MSRSNETRLKWMRRKLSLYKILMTFFVTVLVFGFTAYFSLLILIKGPSKSVSSLVTVSLLETKTFKNTNALRLFFSAEELANIENQNQILENNDVTTPDGEFIIPENEKDDLEIIDIHGATFEGKLMIVRDPSRIQLAVSENIGTGAEGFLVEERVVQMGATAGINAGGFVDIGYQGNGGQAYGIVIQNGELISGKMSDYTHVVGFTENNKLMVGNMTAEQALEYGIRDAVTFSPALIVNYSPVEITGTGGGVNPRTVIGQREDGAVLLLVIDGRQTTSLGATYKDCIEIMQEYGAINASNLDGGSSTVMVYDGEIINNVVNMSGSRRVPTAWIVE